MVGTVKQKQKTTGELEQFEIKCDTVKYEQPKPDPVPVPKP